LARKNKTEMQKFWAAQISKSKTREKPWRAQGDRIVKLYRGPKAMSTRETHSDRNQFNILWSNTEILKAATFSKLSPPNVTRRYKDEDPAARQASEIMERALEFQADSDEFVPNLRKARDDMLLPGRGTNWYEYDADFNLVRMDEIQGPPEVDEAGELIESEAIFQLNGVTTKPDKITDDGAFMEVKAAERVTSKYVYWKDYLQSDSRTEEDVWWKARRHGLSKDELTDLLGEKAVSRIDLPTAPRDTGEGQSGADDDVFEVWEIWSKPTRKRIWFTTNASDTLEVEDVPVKLTGFFPSQKPLFPFETTDTMIPVPEYTIYQPQAMELNIIVRRLTRITRILKVAGVYNGAKEDAVIDMQQLEDGQYKAIHNAMAFGDRGGFAGALFSLPLQEAAAVLQALEARKVILKNEIFEITGISDVMRGDSQVHVTATAERLKGSFGSLRLRPRREPMEEFIRDGYRIMAEIIADNFSAANIQRMTGIQPTDDTMALLRDDRMRSFRIDVETDSTVQPNEEIDMRKAVEYGQVVGSLLQQALPAIQAFPATAPFLGFSLKFISRQFKAGRVVEQELNNLIEQATKLAANPPQPRQDPKDAIAAQRLELDAQKLQIEQVKVALDAQKAQVDDQTKKDIAAQQENTKVFIAQLRAETEDDRTAAKLLGDVLDVEAAEANRGPVN